MTSSLVGSEMCIRDRLYAVQGGAAPTRGVAALATWWEDSILGIAPLYPSMPSLLDLSLIHI
eukprot:9510439-Prorocentrum_lima.AAC.1